MVPCFNCEPVNIPQYMLETGEARRWQKREKLWEKYRDYMQPFKMFCLIDLTLVRPLTSYLYCHNYQSNEAGAAV